MSETAALDRPATKTGPALRLTDLLREIASGKEVFFHHVRTAADLMSMPVEKLTLDNNVGDAVRLMSEHRIRHLPLVDTEGGGEVFIGITSHRDIARQLSAGVGTAAEAESDPAMLKSPLSAVVTRKPHAAAPSTGIFEVVNLMIEKKVDCIPVIDGDGIVAGIITATDIVEVFLILGQLQKMTGFSERRKARLIGLKGGRRALDSKMILETHFKTVGDMMTERPETLGPEAPLAAAIKLMKANGIRHVPIVDPSKRLLGLVSDVEVLHALPPAKEQPGSAPGAEPGFRDRLFAVADKEPALETPLRLVMLKQDPKRTLRRACPTSDAAHLMISEQMTGVLVSSDDEGHSLDGILTTTDFLRGVYVLGQVLGLV